ncbi:MULTISPECIES: TadE/TadG family type IV pilus assembly protein [unclassified Streptomyces]|uniref:TadE/TadG family type IV pilus assembly protein n=1 Tax=unclassified Streptomyces TaxID=2593676 RepID=UPI002E2C0BF1|nr:TadE family protein [Streptomyces sp. NBC_00223]
MRTDHALRRALRRRLDAAHGDSGVGRRATDDRGMTAIEFVFLTPLFFGVIFATVQFAMYYFADHVAQAAARAGAREAREQAEQSDDWAAKATIKANGYIAQLGGNLLTDPVVQPRRTGNTVSVRVTGGVPSIIPGFDLTVDEVSRGPVERFVPDGE